MCTEQYVLYVLVFRSVTTDRFFEGSLADAWELFHHTQVVSQGKTESNASEPQ